MYMERNAHPLPACLRMLSICGQQRSTIPSKRTDMRGVSSIRQRRLPPVISRIRSKKRLQIGSSRTPNAARTWRQRTISVSTGCAYRATTEAICVFPEKPPRSNFGRIKEALWNVSCRVTAACCFITSSAAAKPLRPSPPS